MIKDILFKEFKRDKWILYFSFAIIFGFNILARIYNLSRYYPMLYTNYFSVWSLTLIVAVLISMYLFSYLHNKEKIDLHHRLPLTRKQLYLVNYLKGFMYYSIAYFTTVIILFLLDRFVFFRMPLLTGGFILDQLKNFLIVTLFYTVFVISNILCGMSIYSLLCGIFLLFFPLIVHGFLDNLINTYSQTSEAIGEIILEKLFVNSSYHLSDTIIIILGLLIIIVLLNILGIKLYKLRKSEFASTPIAIEQAKTPLKILSIYGVYCYFVLITDIDGVLFEFIFLIVTTIVCELLINQGLRNLNYKKIIKNIGVVSVIIILTINYVDYGLYEKTFINKSPRDIVVMEVSYNSKMLEEGYVNTEYENLDTTVYITDPEDIEEIFSLLFEFEDNCPSREYTRANLVIKPAKPINVESNDDRYTYTVNVNDEYQKMLFESLVEKLPENNYYKTAYSLVDDGLQFMMNYKTFENVDTEYAYLEESVYPYEYVDVNNEVKSALETDLAYLSSLDVSTFDNIPITTGSYLTKYHNTIATFPVTTDAKNLLDQIDVDEYPYLVYDNLDIWDITYLLENERHIKPYYYDIHENENIFDYDVQIKYFRDDWYSIQPVIDELTNYQATTSTIKRKDVISGNVKIMVYTGEISIDVIKKYDLKLINDTYSNKLYFGYVVE